MNMQGPFFNPFQGFQNNNEREYNIDKIMNKLERLEKNIRILENRINKLENKETKNISQEEPTDMYML